MNEQISVYIELEGKVYLTGRLYIHSRRSNESASFEYDPKWLKHPLRFSLDPTLKLGEGAFHTGPGKKLFGAIGDSAPDRWGRNLMDRAAKLGAKSGNKPLRHLREVDYLLGVNDIARQGALRFSLTEGGDFLESNPSESIPPMTELPKLLNSADSFIKDGGNDDTIRVLLVPGSSLGGARPKATVRNNKSELLLAKFPGPDDTYDEVSWEAITLNLASNAGIKTPGYDLINVSGRKVLLLNRFDRMGGIRVPFISGMSMLESSDHDKRSYLELADVIRIYGANPRSDLHELWRRIVFTVLVSNTDDHMRNHGFLYAGSDGWTLSPMYDVNPDPTGKRTLNTSIDMYDFSASIELALSVHSYFDLTLQESKSIAREMAEKTAQWHTEAKSKGLQKRDIDLLETAFEHDERSAALNL